MLANQQIVFIDSQVVDYQLLANGVLPGIEVVILESDRNGINQITEVFNQRNNFTSIHIVSHGSPGCLYLGNAQLSLDTLDIYKQELKSWFSLSPSLPISQSPSLLIYGCNVAAGDAGEEFITKLHNITGAEIAASTTPIGNTYEGGNWKLNYQTNKVSTPIIFNDQVQNSYIGVFAETTEDEDPSDIAIPDGGTGITRTLNVNEYLEITDISFGLNVDHTYRGDIRVDLTHVDTGTSTTIVSPAFDNLNNYDITLQDGVGGNLDSGSSDTTDTFARSVNSGTAFSAFDNESSYGTWDVTITDGFAGYGSGSYDKSKLTITGNPTQITGNVSESFNGNGINNVTLGLFDSAGTTAIDIDPDTAGTQSTVTTNSSGDYTFSNVAPGTYQVKETQPTDYFDISDSDGGNDDTISVIVALGDTNSGNNFVETAAKITGNVSDGTAGINGVTLELLDEDGITTGTTTTTDSNGDYTFNVAVGDYQVAQVQPTGYENVSEDEGGDDDDLDNGNLDNGNLNNISVTVALGDTDTGNDFVEEAAEVSGTVFIDYDNDGTQETSNTAVESGYEGIIVTAYDATGSIVDQATTDAYGKYGLVTGGVDVRVEFTGIPDNFLGSSLANPDGNTVSSVFFNDGTSQTANFGIFNPNEYVDSSASPDLITTCFVLGSINGSLSGDTAIVSVLHSASGTSPTKTSHATIGEVGSVVGLAVSKETSDVFAGAFQTRFSDIGPEGNAAIYRIDGTTGNVSTFINLEDFFGADIAGEYSHGDNQTQQDSIDGNIDWNADKDAFATVGKIALGDVEISEDRQYIYTVNLADRKVYKIQIGADGDSTATIDYTAGDTRAIETFDIPAGVSGSLELGGSGTRTTQAEVEADLRPFALAEKNGVVYVGLVDSAQSTQSTDDLHAYVYTLDTATGSFTKVLDFDLDYARQNKTGFGVNQEADWSPWIDNFDDFTLTDETGNNKQWINETQPILSDIEFDSDGSMILGFRDRSADQVAGSTLDTDGNTNALGGLYDIGSGGDILRADVSGTNQWIIESGAIDNDEDTEFYDGEIFGTTTHEEAAQGGLVQIPGFNSVETTLLDPQRINSGGIQGLSNTTGDETRGIELFLEGGLDKANGLGDLEYIGSLTTTGIGDRIWDDTDADGVQDAGEAGIGDVTLSLYDDTGTSVATVTTDADGNYYFHEDSSITNGYVASGIDPNAEYEIRVDSTNFASVTGALDGYNLSLANIDNNDEIDSDAIDNNGIPTISVTTGDFGSNNTSYDAGFSTTAYDFGDAPDTATDSAIGDYQTTAGDDGASHIIDDSITIGSVIDADDGTQQNTNANADDSDGTNDDEGVTFTDGTTIDSPDADDTYSVEVIVNAPTPGTTSLAEDEFDTADTGTTTAYNGGSGWIGEWGGYETNQGTTPDDPSSSGGNIRVNDTNDTLELTNDNRGADRAINLSNASGTVNLSFDYNTIGTVPDDGAVPNDIDLLVQISTDDRNSFTTIETIDLANDPTSGSTSVEIPATYFSEETIIRFWVNSPDNGSLGNGNGFAIDNVEISQTVADTTLVGWIDFDRNGVFDPDEAKTLSTADSNLNINGTPNILTWTGFNDDLDDNGGTTYARFRVSTDGDLDNNFSTGLLDDGEVEDYQLTIEGTDYGDAPDDAIDGNYLTSTPYSGSNAASHTIVNGLSIGSTVDGDTGTLQNADATADDTTDSNDDDGIASFPTLETDDDTYSLTVDVTNTTNGDATLIGWIDFDDSGTFEADEAVSVNVADDDTSATLTWNSSDIPDDITGGTTFARFRLSTDDSATFNTGTPGGSASDGEVEDYQLDITQVYDYGDAPDTSSTTTTGDYQTTTSASGTDAPSHKIVNGLSLGSEIDADDGTQQNTAADADDTDVATNDEDGVTFTNGTIIDTDDDSYSVDVNITNTNSENVTLVGWIDFDRSGTFDSDEAVSTSGTISGNQTLNWSSLPADITDGTTYARFRLSTDSNLTTNYPIGALEDGEIEDYQITLNGIDYGDAPDGSAGNGAGDYDTTKANGGAAHTISSNLTIGSAVDGDTGNLENAAATADNTNNTDDEDGITSLTALDSSATSYTLNLDVNNTTGGEATLIGWIDFDQSGTFDDDESVIVPLANNATSATLTWDNTDGVGATDNDIPGDITSGTTYARFRLSTDYNDIDTRADLGLTANQTILGNTANDGEVEDYQIVIEGGSDYADATSSGTDTYNATNTSHLIQSGLSIGATVDEDNGTLENTDATADDLDGADDEDGVDFIDGTVINKNISDGEYSVEIIVNAPDEVTTTPIANDDFTGGDYSGNNTQWVSDWEEDEDGNGSVETTSDPAAGNVTANTNALEIRLEERSIQREVAIPSLATNETVVLSLDHSITGTGIDPGDIPLAIEISTDGGTTFNPVGSISTSSTTATSYSLDITDDITGGNNAIIRFRIALNNLRSPGSDGYILDNIELNKDTAVDSTLVGWIDFDGDGNFDSDEAQELSTADNTPLVTDGVTPNTLTWTGISSLIDTALGDTYARFRLSTDSNLSDSTPDDTGTDIGDGEVEDYKLSLGEIDYGDAPDASAGTGGGNYQTTADDNGATHQIDANLTLGSTIDGDNGTLQNVEADADGSDDDGITTTFNPLGIDNDTYTVNIDVANDTNGNATLIGWIDFDGSGTFDADEAVIIPVADNDGTPTSVALNWSNLDGSTDNDIPSDIISGTTYARFRISNDFDGITTRDDITNNPDIFSDVASDGEVEDYKVFIGGGTDYGDAPDDGTNGSYFTSTTNSGANAANHGIVEGLSIGDTVDSDSGLLQNDAATADNNDGTDDEDGITSFATLETDDDIYSISVDVTNTTANTAKLVGWIDFDGNGVFDADEAVETTVNIDDTSATLTWNDSNIPADIVGGDTFARFRLSTDTNLTTSLALGALDDGEVEDYQLTITEVKDYGDAPDTTTGTDAGDYQTTTTNSGTDAPNHVIVDGLSLGTDVDSDDGTQANSDATADDTVDASDDEDGVTLSNAGVFDSDDGTYSVGVNITNDNNQNVTVVGWIDFDQSGTFDSDEAVSASGTLTGNQTLTWSSFPADIVRGDTFARFRLSTDDDLDTSFSTGKLSDGEIEDYQVTINGVDYGDAPDTSVGESKPSSGEYSTTLADGGAAHNIISGLNLGTTVDADTGTAQNTAATSDNINGTDDEDGVSSFNTLSVNDANGNYTVSIDVNHTTGLNASLIGWIDFDQSGTFDNDEESDIISGTDIDGNQTLTWTNNVPTDIKGGTTYARFRLSDRIINLTEDDSKGLIGNGEVEDYQITVEGGTDFGDATGINYATATTSHDIVDGISIGDSVDSEASVTPNAAASTDDDTGSEDEDGVDFIDTKVISQNDSDDEYSVEVIVNSTATSSTVIATDDFGTAGSYAGGSQSGTGSDWNGAWTEDDDGTPNTVAETEGRVRINNGQLEIRNNGNGITRNINIPASATGSITLSFDYSETTSTGGNPLNAGDNLTISINGDSDTVLYNSGETSKTIDITSFVTPGSTATIGFNTNALSGVESDDGYNIDNVSISTESTADTTLVGWVDFDRDGTFDTDEGVSLSTADGTPLVADGTTVNTLTWTGINAQTNGVTPGDTYARFRLSSDTDLTTSFATGVLDDGEIEDYVLKIKNEVTGTGAGDVINDSSTDPTTANDDLIIGGAGQDTLTGGDGDDCFHYNRTSDGIDIITDFNNTTEEDKLDFSDMFATGGELAGISDPFGTYVVVLAADTPSDGTMIQVDFDGTGDNYAKSVVFLQGYDNTVNAITADDFIF